MLPSRPQDSEIVPTCRRRIAPGAGWVQMLDFTDFGASFMEWALPLTMVLATVGLMHSICRHDQTHLHNPGRHEELC